MNTEYIITLVITESDPDCLTDSDILPEHTHYIPGLAEYRVKMPPPLHPFPWIAVENTERRIVVGIKFLRITARYFDVLTYFNQLRKSFDDKISQNIRQLFLGILFLSILSVFPTAYQGYGQRGCSIFTLYSASPEI